MLIFLRHNENVSLQSHCKHYDDLTIEFEVKYKMTSVPPVKTKATNEVKNLDEKYGEMSDKKLTVLETHGYAIGNVIGVGSYATVKVYDSIYMYKLLKNVIYIRIRICMYI